MMAKFSASDFTASKAKPLPIILLLDTSGSMHGGKIRLMNEAVRKMLGTFTKEESQANEFLVSIIAFGGHASLVVSPTPASAIAYADLAADGLTPLGEAIDVATALIADRERTPSRAYRPLVVLVSDGVPTDSWERKLEDFLNNGRSSKCDRMALGIGAEATTGLGRATLERFVAGTGHQVFEANDATEIHKFFKFVTMSVVTRVLSQNPNTVPQDSTLELPRQAVEPQVSVAQGASASEDQDSYW